MIGRSISEEATVSSTRRGRDGGRFGVVPGSKSLAQNRSFHDVTLPKTNASTSEAFPVREDWSSHKSRYRAGQVRPSVQPLSDKAMKLMGVTKEQVARSRALNRMGLTEDDVDSAERVWRVRRNQDKAIERRHGSSYAKAAKQLGHEPATLLAGKALRKIGVSPAEFDEKSAMMLAGLGYNNIASPATVDGGVISPTSESKDMKEEPASPSKSPSRSPSRSPMKSSSEAVFSPPRLGHPEFPAGVTRGGAGSFVVRGRVSSPIPGARAPRPSPPYRPSKDEEDSIRPGTSESIGHVCGNRGRSRSQDRPIGKSTFSIDIGLSLQSIPMSPVGPSSTVGTKLEY